VQAHPSKRPHLSFVLLMVLMYLPILFALSMIQAKWFGWLGAVLSFGLLFWMHSKSFWHSWRIVLCFVIAYVVALLGLYIAQPVWDISFSAQVGRGMVRTFTSLPKQDQELGKSLLSQRGWKPPDGYTYEVVPLTHSKLELLRKTDSTSKRAILQYHGGAFVAGLNDLYRQFAVKYSELFGGCLVATLDYRLAPMSPYPSQQDDAMDAWHYLTETLDYPAASIVVVGDSAGGNLALSLGLRLRDLGEPLPAGFVCMSPWADLSNSGCSHVYNATVDPSFGIDPKDFHGQPVGVDSTYTNGIDATDPYVSPSFGNYLGFPPMLLQVGSIEVLLSDSEMVYENAHTNGVDCTLTVYNGMFHVFQGALDLLPESTSAWEEIGQFLAKRMQ